MCELDHDGCTLFMPSIGQTTDVRYNLIFIDQQIAESRRTIFGNSGRSGSHCHTDPASSALDVVSDITAFRHTIFGISRLMRGGNYAVAKFKMFQLVGLEYRVHSEQSTVFIVI